MVEVIHGDCLEVMASMPEASIQCCVTSPPYWGLRDYGVDGQLGLEPTPEAYVEALTAVFDEVRRVLRPDGTLWLNLGDSYAGSGRGGGGSYEPERSGWAMTASRRRDDAPCPRSDVLVAGLKPKDLVGIPWRVAFALQAAGWWLRSDIIWSKPNPMPESVTDRPTKAHEYLFLLSKRERYYYDADQIREVAVDTHDAGNGFARPERISRDGRGNAEAWKRDGSGLRNARSVWTIPTQPFSGAHFAVMPLALAERCVMAGSRPGDTVLDPFAGAATVGVAARKHRRHFVGIELNPDYARMARGRLGQDVTAELPEEDAPLFNRNLTPEVQA